MLGIINFTLIAMFANVNRIGDHIPQHRQIDGIAAVSDSIFLMSTLWCWRI